jgi:hypothetical protein
MSLFVRGGGDVEWLALSKRKRYSKKEEESAKGLNIQKDF